MMLVLCYMIIMLGHEHTCLLVGWRRSNDKTKRACSRPYIRFEFNSVLLFHNHNNNGHD